MQKRIQIVYKALDELKLDPKNPRRNDAAVQAVAESMREFGFRVPIVIDENDMIRAGETRYKAASLLNKPKVPCVIASDLTEKQLRAFQLADNKTGELATWDLGLLDAEMNDLAGLFDMSLFGFAPKKGKDEESLMGDKDSSKGKDKYITCPRCGKRFLKSEGHPKEGGSFDTAMYAPYENHEEDEPGLPKAWTPDGTEDDGGDW